MMSSVISRRDFLQAGSAAVAGLALKPSFLFGQPERDRPIFIVVFQRGAADGISMVVPFGDKSYYSARPQIGIPEPAQSADERTIDLDGFFGLHPALGSLKPIYDEQRLAIFHAVGSPNNTRSHFDAQDYMESGVPGTKSVPDGWLNRYMQVNSETSASPFRGVALSSTMPRTLMGPVEAVAMNRLSDFGIRFPQGGRQLEDMFARMYPDTFEAVKMLRAANPEQYKPAAGVQYPASAFGQTLLQISQLVKANVGLQVAFADVGGWDTHANQGAARGQLSTRLKEFGDGLAALYRDLGDHMRNVVVLTMTEFGRSIRQNGSGGTDHGHASCMFAFGGPVKGGKIYGRWPGLSTEALFEGRDLAVTTDFRAVFSEILVKHMRSGNVSRIFPGFSPESPANFLG
jgi:uncharacterized protein (DUF1501 family)